METQRGAEKTFVRDEQTGELRVRSYGSSVRVSDVAQVTISLDSNKSSAGAVLEQKQTGGAGSFETPMVPGPDSFQNFVIFPADSSKGDLA